MTKYAKYYLRKCISGKYEIHIYILNGTSGRSADQNTLIEHKISKGAITYSDIEARKCLIKICFTENVTFILCVFVHI